MDIIRTRASRWAYALAMALTRTLLWLFVRWEVHGRERVPPHGPLVYVANHTHVMDPPLVAAASRRRVHPMAKHDLFAIPLVGRAIWLLGAFPVRRFSGDSGALRTARRLLSEGRVVLMFPEGTRSHGRPLQPALPGAGMVALMAGSGVVPVAITGAEHGLRTTLVGALRARRVRITVTFGEPFDPATASGDGRDAAAATDRMMREIAALLPEERRGVYGADTAGRIVVQRPDERDGDP